MAISRVLTTGGLKKAEGVALGRNKNRKSTQLANRRIKGTASSQPLQVFTELLASPLGEALISRLQL